ncbi:MAG: SPASM domain-containing protein [bacterium]
MRPSSFCIVVALPGEERSLLFHGYSGAVDLVHPRVVELLRDPTGDVAAGDGGISQEALDLLRRRGYLTEWARDEERAYVRELGERVHKVSRRHAPGGFLLIPTYSCNLRCSYCYEQSLRSHGRAWLEERMDRLRVDAAFAAMDRIDPVSKTGRSLGLYGGEPLQRANREIVEYVMESASSRGFTAFSAITNGVDLDGYLDLLGPGRIRFLQVTLDGPPEIHDRRRVLADGSGTFHRIGRNVTRALETGARVSVRINVDPSNLEGLARLREFVVAQGWPERSNFRAYCSPVHGRLEDARAVSSFESFAGHIAMQEAIEQVDPGGDGPLERCAVTSSLSRTLLAHLRNRGLPRWKTGFCGSNLAMYLFDPHGDIYPCWEVVGHRQHRIGWYRNGAAVWVDREEAGKWHERSVVRVQGCLDCAYLFFCGGGCESAAYQKKGSLDRPDCSDFPEIFRRAAVLAYREHVRGPEAAAAA